MLEVMHLLRVDQNSLVPIYLRMPVKMIQWILLPEAHGIYLVERNLW